MTYLGHKIDANGLHPLQGRIRAIRDTPTPTSVSVLKSHLGMLTYYSKFLSNLSSFVHPLYRLLRKDVSWQWGPDQERAFTKSKELLTSANCLTHIDSSLDLPWHAMPLPMAWEQFCPTRCLTEPLKTVEEPELVLLAEHLAESPVTAQDIQAWTWRDSKLSQVLHHVQKGWPTECDPEIEPYSSRRLEYSSYEACVMWGSRIIVPPPGRQAVLLELHEGHPGISRMKPLARMYVWWPGINADNEKSVRLCRECQQVQSSPPVAPLSP